MAKIKLASIGKTSLHKLMEDVQVLKVPITRKEFKVFKPFLSKCVQEEGTVFILVTAESKPTYTLVWTMWRANNINEMKVS